MLLLDSILLILVMVMPIGVVAGLSLFIDVGGKEGEEYTPRAGWH